MLLMNSQFNALQTSYSILSLSFSIQKVSNIIIIMSIKFYVLLK